MKQNIKHKTSSKYKAKKRKKEKNALEGNNRYESIHSSAERVFPAPTFPLARANIIVATGSTPKNNGQRVPRKVGNCREYDERKYFYHLLFVFVIIVEHWGNTTTKKTFPERCLFIWKEMVFPYNTRPPPTQPLETKFRFNPFASHQSLGGGGTADIYLLLLLVKLYNFSFFSEKFPELARKRSRNCSFEKFSTAAR